MSDLREKLIEILRTEPFNYDEFTADRLAAHLIAYGVRLEASKQETHGDVIRAMSDEALGAYLCFVINAYHKVCDKCPASSLCSSEGIGLIKWLGLPADPENE